MSGPSDEYFLQVATGATGPIEATGPPPPPTITLTEILSEQQVLLQKELNDKATLESISQLSIETLRAKLIAWAVAGLPNAYEIHRVTITPPSACSDGVVRNLADYVVFCSGKTMAQHVAPLQITLPDIQVGFVSTPPVISVVVTTAQ